MRQSCWAVVCIVLPSCLGAGAEEAPVPDSGTGVQNQVRLALLRGVPVKWDLEANFQVFLQRVAEADEAGAQVFVTPECWLDGYAAPDPESTPERLRGIAQPLDKSPYLQRVAEEARTRGLYICFGFTSLEHDQIFNACGLWDVQGRLIGLYHKTHLQTHDLQFSYGESLSSWSTPWGPLGMMICADRRWPETVRTLRLQGARLILNPTYGFHGDLNTAMMRTRAYENQCFIAFAHPEESLVTGPKGRIVAQETGGPGLLLCDIDLAEARGDGHLADRRPELYAPLAEGGSAATLKEQDGEGPVLRVAAAQMLSTFDVPENARKIVEFLEEAKRREVQVVAFPELALSGYTKQAEFREKLDWAAVEVGLTEIQAACDRLELYAVVGAPTRDGDHWYCTAVTIDPQGQIVDRYEKIYLAGEKWASPGRKLSTFDIAGIQSATFICHDERYAPLVQLRALAGAQLFFYISCESGLSDLHKLNPYRAQVQARAQENQVFLVHANTPAAPDATGLADVSHGQSRIIDPDGNIVAEAPEFGEQLVVADLAMGRASKQGRAAALGTGPLAAWMQEGLKLVNAAPSAQPAGAE